MDSEWSHGTFVNHGYCDVTAAGHKGNCKTGLLGSWIMDNKYECMQRCRGCAQCQYVSFSHANKDCSWFNECATDSLGTLFNGESYATYHVKKPRRRSTSLAECKPNQEELAPRRALRKKSQLHMVSFYSEGHPHDGGMALGAAAGVLKVAYKPHVDSYHAYTPRSLANRTLVWRNHEAIRGSELLQPSAVDNKYNKGQAAIGHFAAKPFLILLRLLEIPVGEMLLYKDANVKKHPQLLGGASNVQQTVRWVLRHANVSHDVFMPYENDRLKLKHHCKAHAIRTLAPHSMHDKLFEAPLQYAATVLVRRSEQSEVLLWHWLQLCMYREVLEPLPNPQPHPEFRWHTPEQCMFAIASILNFNTFARRLRYCWTFEIDSMREIDAPMQKSCYPPFASTVKTWLPTKPTRWGLCLSTECRLGAQNCQMSTGELMLPWKRPASVGKCHCRGR